MVLHCTVLQVAALADDYTAEPQAADDVDLAVSAVGRGRGGGRGEGRGPGWVGGCALLYTNRGLLEALIRGRDEHGGRAIRWCRWGVLLYADGGGGGGN